MKVLLNALAAIPQGTAANPMTSKVSSPPFGMSSPATTAAWWAAFSWAGWRWSPGSC